MLLEYCKIFCLNERYNFDRILLHTSCVPVVSMYLYLRCHNDPGIHENYNEIWECT